MKMEAATSNGDWVNNLSFTWKQTIEIWQSQFTVGGPVASSCAAQHLAKYLTEQVRSEAERCSIAKVAGPSLIPFRSSWLPRLFIASFNSILLFSILVYYILFYSGTITSHVCEFLPVSPNSYIHGK